MKKPTADKPIHCLWLQAKDGLVNANPDFKKLRLGSKFQTCQVDCHQDEAHAWDIHTVSGQLGLSVGNQKSSETITVCWLIICTKKNNFQTRPAFAELLSFPKSTMGELQPVAKDSVQGIPIAAIISVPISGRQCF